MYENEIYSNSDNGRYTTYQTNSTAFNPNEGGRPGDESGKKKKGGFRKVLFSMALGLAFGACAGAGFYAVQVGAGQFSQTENTALHTDDVNGGSLPTSLTNVNHVTYVRDDISDVVEDVMPAMVSIINNYTVTGTTFWGQTYSQPYEGSGSGIIVQENETELLIVTNNHVVDGADTLKVVFIDNSVAEAAIRGVDADMDLAVIAVAKDGLSEETRNAITVATLGDSDSLRLGEPVIAIGNALGIGQSVTNGIISALNREMTTEDGNANIFIQTNAAINRGNSGGALLNINGEVIGINSNKLGGDTVEGMGYAIPISSASPIIAELMERRTEIVEEDEKGYMGITPQEVTDRAVQQYGMPKGVFVNGLEEGYPAEQAGMKKGDILVKFDGQKVTSYADLQNIMQHYKAGESVIVTVKRVINGEYEELDLEITLGSRPEGR